MLRRAAVLVALAAAFVPAAAASAPPPVPLAPVPAFHLGSGTGQPASLFRPTTFRQTFRVAPSDTALYLITGPFTAEMHVQLIGPGDTRRTLVATDDLPGRALGIRLPVDAWRADRIELAGTAVSDAASASLVPAESFGTLASRDWWRIAAFGAFVVLALGIAAAAVRLGNVALAAPAVLAAASAAQLVPWLGVIRFPPAVGRPLAALEAIVVLGAVYAAVFAVARGALDVRWRRALAIVVAAQAVALLGADVLQDQWPTHGAQGSLLAFAAALALTAAALFAYRAAAAGAATALWATSVGAAAAAATVSAPEGSTFAASVPVLAALAQTVLLALAVGAGTRGTVAVREAAERPLLGDPAVDPLTRLPNGRALDVALENAWQHALRDDAPLGAVVVDIDRFARYNAAAGHRAGDDVVRAAGAAVANAAVPAHAFVARAGGDVFAVLVPHATPDVARSVGEDVIAAVAALAIEHPGSARVVTASAGVASCAPAREGGMPSSLLVRAGAALTIAKALGRNRVVLEEEMQPSVRRA